MPAGMQRVLVFGAGRTGAAVVDAVLRRDGAVTVLETGTSDRARAGAQQLAAQGVPVLTDAAAIDLDDFDLVVPSPGVAEHHPLLVAAATAGTPVWSEPELAWRLTDGRTDLVAVTGTNGKTTTTELLAACLQAPTAGNIGTPLVELLAGSAAPPLVVAELSSFQLRFAETLRPRVAVLLNVAPDHLDWHGSVGAYRSAKARIWQRQHDQDVAVVNADDEGARATAAAHPPPAATISFTLGSPTRGQVGIRDGAIVSALDGTEHEVVGVAELGAKGPHNVANACAAVAAALSAGADVGQLGGPLRNYRAGKHRLEAVATVAGVDYVDDSKATNPHAAAAALQSFPPKSVVWIAGGLGKGLDFSALRPLVATHVRAAMTIGTSSPELAAVVRAAGVDVVEAGTLDVAVAEAAAVAEAGDTVLLAPACASMDQFTDYAERGEAFRRAVDEVARSKPAQGAGRGR